jgi:hypothetical protein
LSNFIFVSGAADGCSSAKIGQTLFFCNPSGSNLVTFLLFSGWARDVIAGRWGMRLLVAGERDGGQEGGLSGGVLQIKGEFVIFAQVIV